MEQAAGRAALLRAAEESVQRVLRRRPARWRENLAPYVHLLEQADALLRQLRIEEIEQIFPEKGNCTVKARWEVLWLKREYGEKCIGEIGLEVFLHSYRVNEDVRLYVRLHDFVRAILRPRNFPERLRTMFYRLCNILP